MNCSEVRGQLDAALENDLPPGVRADVEEHLAHCPRCRAERDAARALRARARSLSRDLDPKRELWSGILSQLADPKPRPVGWRGWTLGIAAAAALVVGLLGVRLQLHSAGWKVSLTSETSESERPAAARISRIKAGQWLETDAASRARVAVGSIGELELEPNSRLRVVDTAAADHRVELAKGTLHAVIWAPPRLFFVDTPSATAVDLGCAYTLTVDERGRSLLTVTSGYVALENRGRESIIPAHMTCITRPGQGPGTPFAEDASAALRGALDRFDDDGGDAALNAVLRAAGAADAVTLWHLLTEARSSEQRGRIFDTLAPIAAPPPEVTRAEILAGAPGPIEAWGVRLACIHHKTGEDCPRSSVKTTEAD